MLLDIKLKSVEAVGAMNWAFILPHTGGGTETNTGGVAALLYPPSTQLFVVHTPGNARSDRRLSCTFRCVSASTHVVAKLEASVEVPKEMERPKKKHLFIVVEHWPCS